MICFAFEEEHSGNAGTVAKPVTYELGNPFALNSLVTLGQG